MQERYLAWLEELRTLSRETLGSFFEPVHREAKGRPQVWRNGAPEPVADPDEAIAHRAPFFAQLKTRMRRVMGLEREDGPMVDAGEHPEMLAEVFEWNVEASRLLPIGSVNARLLLSEDQPRWMALNVRTYIAEFPKHEDESLRPSRYQLRMWPAGGGETEVEELRREIGRLGTDRLMTTRILDLNMASVERMAWFEPDGHEYTGYADSVMDGRRPAAEVTEEYRKTTAVVALESDDLWNPNWGELRGDRGEGE